MGCGALPMCDAGLGAERISFDDQTGEVQLMDSRYWQRPEVCPVGVSVMGQFAGSKPSGLTNKQQQRNPKAKLALLDAHPRSIQALEAPVATPVAGYREHILHVACDARPQVA